MGMTEDEGLGGVVRIRHGNRRHNISDEASQSSILQQESDKGNSGERAREQGQKRSATERLKDQGVVEERLRGDEGKCVTHDVRHASRPSSRSKTDSRTQGSMDGDSKQR